MTDAPGTLSVSANEDNQSTVTSGLCVTTAVRILTVAVKRLANRWVQSRPFSEYVADIDLVKCRRRSLSLASRRVPNYTWIYYNK
jgi:hypothetical protein